MSIASSHGRRVSAAILAFMISTAAWPSGEILWATNSGTDTSTCGSVPKPCRSISQAIENASAGDTIWVGAGRYGNISGDGSFSHPGDEHPQLITPLRDPSDNGTTGCMICITKPVTILSAHGASITVIEGVPGVPGSNLDGTVLIESGGVTFGAPGAGFTITGGNPVGVLLFEALFGAVRVGIDKPPALSRVGGNIDIGDGTGFLWVGRAFIDTVCRGPPDGSIDTCPAVPVTYTGNEAIKTGTGFGSVTNADFAGSAITFRGNLATGGGTGFGVSPGFQSEAGTVTTGASSVSLIGNVATHNDVGFNTNLAGTMTGNTASANARAGFFVVPNSNTFKDNSAFGNSGPGVVVNFSADFFDDGSGFQKVFASFTQNNFFGNDRNRVPQGITTVLNQPLDVGPSAHCGILNIGAAANVILQPPPVAQKLPATGNYWGSAAGPSPTGPADAAGGPCDQNGGQTVTKPFAKSAFSVTTLP